MIILLKSMQILFFHHRTLSIMYNFSAYKTILVDQNDINYSHEIS